MRLTNADIGKRARQGKGVLDTVEILGVHNETVWIQRPIGGTELRGNSSDWEIVDDPLVKKPSERIHEIYGKFPGQMEINSARYQAIVNFLDEQWQERQKP